MDLIKNRLLLVVVLFLILGSVTVTSMDSFSYTFKSIFNGIAIAILIVIGSISLYQYVKKDKV